MRGSCRPSRWCLGLRLSLSRVFQLETWRRNFTPTPPNLFPGLSDHVDVVLPLLQAAYTVTSRSPEVVGPYSEALYLAGRDAEVSMCDYM